MFKKWLNEIKCKYFGHKLIYGEKESGIFVSGCNQYGQIGIGTAFALPQNAYAELDYKIKTCSRCGVYLGYEIIKSK